MNEGQIFYKPLTIQHLVNASNLHGGSQALTQKQLFTDASDMSFIEVGQIDGYDYTNILMPAFLREYADYDDYSRSINDKGGLDIAVPESISKTPFVMRRATFDDMAECTGLSETQTDLRMFSLTMGLPEIAFAQQPYTLYLYFKESYLFLMGMPLSLILLMGSSVPDSPSQDVAS